MTGVISAIVTPKHKTKSNPFAGEKSGSHQNLQLVSSLSQWHEQDGVLTAKDLPASKHGCKMNRGNKSAS